MSIWAQGVLTREVFRKTAPMMSPPCARRRYCSYRDVDLMSSLYSR